jgi:hypothetical protein
MGKVCHGVDLEYGNESQTFVRLSTEQEAWLTESVDAMERGAAPAIMGPSVRRAIECRFADNFAALSQDEWVLVAKRGLEAAARAGRIAAELAQLDNSQEIRRRHALAGLQAVRAICDRSMSLTRLAERRGRVVGVGRRHDHEAIRVAS